MLWKEYTKKALATSTHATREKRISCCLFGLLGETFEYEEKKNLFMPKEIDVKRELGDVCWYLAVLSHEIKHTPIFIRDGEHTPILECISKLQEYMKKDYRDFDYAINKKYRSKIVHELNTIYTYLLEECANEMWNFDEILQLNIDKLQDRKERDVLKGAGDNR